MDHHRFKGKVENCWICLEISVTRSRKILKNICQLAPGARRGLVWPVASGFWRGARTGWRGAQARVGLLILWKICFEEYLT